MYKNTSRVLHWGSKSTWNQIHPEWTGGLLNKRQLLRNALSNWQDDLVSNSSRTNAPSSAGALSVFSYPKLAWIGEGIQESPGRCSVALRRSKVNPRLLNESWCDEMSLPNFLNDYPQNYQMIFELVWVALIFSEPKTVQSEFTALL